MPLRSRLGSAHCVIYFWMLIRLFPDRSACTHASVYFATIYLQAKNYSLADCDIVIVRQLSLKIEVKAAWTGCTEK